jgi:hypothetical protein
MVNRTCGAHEAGKRVLQLGELWVRRWVKRRKEKEERLRRRRTRKSKERTRRSGSGVELETTANEGFGVMDRDTDFRPDLETMEMLRVE